MKHIKSYLRKKSLGISRLALSTTLQLKKREAKSLDIDEIINKFADAHE